MSEQSIDPRLVELGILLNSILKNHEINPLSVATTVEKKRGSSYKDDAEVRILMNNHNDTLRRIFPQECQSFDRDGHVIRFQDTFENVGTILTKILETTLEEKRDQSPTQQSHHVTSMKKSPQGRTI